MLCGLMISSWTLLYESGFVTGYTPEVTVQLEFLPSDNWTAEELSSDSPLMLFLINHDSQDESEVFVFPCLLGDVVEFTLLAGTYSIAALVFDEYANDLQEMEPIGWSISSYDILSDAIVRLFIKLHPNYQAYLQDMSRLSAGFLASIYAAAQGDVEIESSDGHVTVELHQKRNKLKLEMIVLKKKYKKRIKKAKYLLLQMGWSVKKDEDGDYWVKKKHRMECEEDTNEIAAQLLILFIGIMGLDTDEIYL